MQANKKNGVLFLNLSAFSLTGGIEKFNKSFLKALYELKDEIGYAVESLSMHDATVDEKYFPKNHYKTFAGNKLSFVAKSIVKAKDFDTIILGHINLAVVGCFIKRLYPQKKIVLITHGIEVWTPLSGFKKWILKKADIILSVSNYTKNKLVDVHNINSDRVKIFYNTIDPFFCLPSRFSINKDLRKKYKIDEDAFVLYTLTRLSSSEKYKGYDVVVKSLPQLKMQVPNLKYVIGGKYDDGEKQRLDKIIQENNLQDTIIFLGFIKDEEIQPHYQMSDVFIMPSKGEGFGIVFIEAMVCGLPVVAGNRDGSVDAVQNGELGTLVDPDNIDDISNAVLGYYKKGNKSEEWKEKLQARTLDIFGFKEYKERLKNII